MNVSKIGFGTLLTTITPPSDGEWKESVLRAMLSQRLPDTVKVGRGFILRPGAPSTQCDVLLYRADHPIPFRDGDFVFVPSDAVLGVIEVKSRFDRKWKFKEAIAKLAAFGELFPRELKRPVLCLFAYEKAGMSRDWFSSVIPDVCNRLDLKIDLVSIGRDDFVKWWDRAPTGPANRPYGKWHSYFLESMAAGYFLANVIDLVTDGLVSKNDSIWYPDGGKEAIGQTIAISPQFGAD